MANEKRDVVFWGFDGDERLTHTELDEAIEAHVDDCWPMPPSELPEAVEFCGYARVEIDVERLADDAIEPLLEHLDEEYGDPNGGYTEATEKMKAAALAFARTVLDEYDIWACEIVERETVNLHEWIAKNAPDYEAECNSDRAKEYRARMERLKNAD